MKSSALCLTAVVFIFLSGEWGVNGFKKKNGVFLQCIRKPSTIQILVDAYNCLGFDSSFDICNKKSETLKCLIPVSVLFASCFPNGHSEADDEGYFMEIFRFSIKLACAEDYELPPGFMDTMMEDSLAMIMCVSSDMDEIVRDTVECFGRHPDSLKLHGATQQGCLIPDSFTECFLDSMEDVCGDRVRKLVSNFFNMGLQKIIEKYVFKCNV